MRPHKLFAILFLISLLFISSCTSQNKTATSPKLTTTITPARDVTGRWTGSASFQENVEGAECLFQGTFVLNLQQQGNSVQGNFVFTETAFHETKVPTTSLIPQIGCSGPVDKTTRGSVQGTVSSSAIDLSIGAEKVFAGSFTTDLMKLTLTACLVQNDQECTVDDTLGTLTLMRSR